MLALADLSVESHNRPVDVISKPSSRGFGVVGKDTQNVQSDAMQAHKHGQEDVLLWAAGISSSLSNKLAHYLEGGNANDDCEMDVRGEVRSEK